jgi:acetyl esterase/lipase
MIHDAGKDERILAGWPAYEAALQANKVNYQHFVYAGAEHGFNNDTTPRYDVFHILNILVPLTGIELVTFALRMRCSTN